MTTTMQYTLTEIKEQIFILTINRPDKLNALNKATIEEIAMAIAIANKDNQVKGIIITGSGEKAFIAGADISEFSQFGYEQGKALSAYGQSVFNTIEQSKKPVLALVNGFALGGGCELAMACHLRIASSNAKFGQPEANLGIIPGYSGTQRLVQLVGKTKALELMMTCDTINAQQALDLGMVNYVVESSDLMNTGMKMMQKITSKAPVAIAQIIKCVNDYFDYSKDGSNSEVEGFGTCIITEDFKEGTTAFLEKRKANFIGA